MGVHLTSKYYFGFSFSIFLSIFIRKFINIENKHEYAAFKKILNNKHSEIFCRISIVNYTQQHNKISL